MLEAITITKQNKYDNDRPLDMGALIESMLFYGKTTVTADYSILNQLFWYFGGDRLLRLVKENYLHVTYVESNVGIITNTESNIEYHDVTQFSSPNHTFQNEIRKICIATPRSEGNARRLAQKLEKYIRPRQHDPLVLKGAKKTILDQSFVESSAQIIIRQLNPNFANTSDFLFRTHESNKGIEIETNLNFKELNQIINKAGLSRKGAISPAEILCHILDFETELYFAANHLSDLSCCNLSSELATNKIDCLFQRSKKNATQLSSFKQGVFINANSIREAANENRLDLDYLFTALEKSRRLKEIYLDLPLEGNLLQIYHDDLTRDTIYEKYPLKLLKWVAFASSGVVFADIIPQDPLTQNTGAAAFDAFSDFLIGRFFSGWKPNQFINKELKKLIKEKPE